jgi:hypothetical protein
MEGLKVLFSFQVLIPVVALELQRRTTNAAKNFIASTFIATEGDVGVTHGARDV